MLQTLILLFCFSLVLGQTTNVEQCIKNEGDLPLNVHIEGCLEPPCILPHRETVVAHIAFKSPRSIKSMTTLATAYLQLGVLPISVPYSLGDNAVTCDFLTNSHCPIMADEIVQYTLRMYIEPTFPAGTSTTIEFRVVDDDSGSEKQKTIFCFRVPIKITSSTAIGLNSLLNNN